MRSSSAAPTSWPGPDRSPDAGDIAFHRSFLLREIGLVRPRMLVARGGTVLRALARQGATA
jgi:uracil-DNA glycosylase